MKMSCENMNVTTMNVYIYENSLDLTGQVIQNGDYQLVLLSDQSLALSGSIDMTKVELFTYTQGADDQLWAFVGNGNANTAFRISNIAYADYMTSEPQEGAAVVLASDATFDWFMEMTGTTPDGEMIVKVGFVRDDSLFIGTASTPSQREDCILVSDNEALEFILKKRG